MVLVLVNNNNPGIETNKFLFSKNMTQFKNMSTIKYCVTVVLHFKNYKPNIYPESTMHEIKSQVQVHHSCLNATKKP